MKKSKSACLDGNNLIPEPHKRQKSNCLSLRSILLYVVFLFQPWVIMAQEARIITFNHTLRWLTETSFPNYFLLRDVRDTINADIQKYLVQQFNVTNVTFPDKVDYHIINGFGKPKYSSSESNNSAGYDAEIYSFLTRATTGKAVFWSVNVIIRKDGNIVHQKEVRHEIENSNISAYMKEVRWVSPHEFQKIFGELFREAIGIGGDYSAKIIVGDIMEKEKEMRQWFPGSTRYLLKKNGAWLNAGNFAAQMMNDNDTVLQFGYRNRLEFKFGKISLKPILADLFTELTGLGSTYSITEKERKRGVLEFSGGKNLQIEMNWIEEVTAFNITGETKRQITVPLVGQIYTDTTLVGNFIYEKITQTLVSDQTREKFSWASGPYNENSFGTVVIHRVKGNLGNKPFTAEYNELFGLVEIKRDNQTLATMIVQNCNPENPNSFDKMRISKNKSVISESGSNIGKPSIGKGSKPEWYPFFVKANATADDMVTGVGIMVCLFFGIGNM